MKWIASCRSKFDNTTARHSMHRNQSYVKHHTVHVLLSGLPIVTRTIVVHHDFVHLICLVESDFFSFSFVLHPVKCSLEYKDRKSIGLKAKFIWQWSVLGFVTFSQVVIFDEQCKGHVSFCQFNISYGQWSANLFYFPYFELENNSRPIFCIDFIFQVEPKTISTRIWLWI